MAKVTVNYSGTKVYWDSKFKKHRDDGPARIYKTGRKDWFINGAHIMQFQPNGFYWVHIDDVSVASVPSGHTIYLNYEGKVKWPKL